MQNAWRRAWYLVVDEQILACAPHPWLFHPPQEEMAQGHWPRAVLGRFTESLSLLAKWHLCFRDTLSPAHKPVPFPPGAWAAASLRQPLSCRWELVAKRRRGRPPWPGRPANPRPVLQASPRPGPVLLCSLLLASPRPSSPEMILPLPQSRLLEEPTPSPHISHQMSSQRLGQPGTPRAPVPAAQDPAGIWRECASWARAQFCLTPGPGPLLIPPSQTHRAL